MEDNNRFDLPEEQQSSSDTEPQQEEQNSSDAVDLQEEQVSAKWNTESEEPLAEPEDVQSESDTETLQDPSLDTWKTVEPESTYAGQEEENFIPPKRHTGIKVCAVILALLLVFSAITVTGYALMGAFSSSSAAVESTLETTEEPLVDDTQSGTAPTVELQQRPIEETVAAADGELTTEEIYDRLGSAVVGLDIYFYDEDQTNYSYYSTGSGVVMNQDGYIITNAHVVLHETTSMEADEIKVVLDNGDELQAIFIGADVKTDLAVVKVEPGQLPYASFGDSDDIKVGERAVVIGNPTGQVLASSVTQGIISGLNRSVPIDQYGMTMTLIQTDAAVNPGNSGGALINKYGQVVGIVSSKISQVSYEGIGFAIPMNTVKSVVDDILESGYVTGRVRIGITYRLIEDEFAAITGVPSGLRVVSVAEDAGAYGILQPGDIIMQIEGLEVRTAQEIANVLEQKQPDETVQLLVYRTTDTGGEKLTLDIPLTEDMTYAVGYQESIE